MPTFEPFAEEEFTEDDWKEAVSTYRPGGADTFSNTSADVSLTVLIDATKQRSARNWVLGYAWADDASPWELHRSTPVGHPFWGTQLRATAVTFQPFAPEGNEDNENNEPYSDSEVGFGGISKYTRYAKAWMTVRFEPKPFYLYEDDDPEWSGFEYDRYTIRYAMEPNIEVLQAEAGRYIRWQEGPSGVTGVTFPGAIGELLTKCTFVMTWLEVPAGFVEDVAGVPSKVLAAAGRVNSADFLGFPAGTLQLQAPRFEKHLYPYYSEDGRAYHYTILLPFLWFDPTPSAASPLGRGHHLFPNRAGGANGGPGWYYATRDTVAGASSGPTGPTYLEQANFADIFTHAQS